MPDPDSLAARGAAIFDTLRDAEVETEAPENPAETPAESPAETPAEDADFGGLDAEGAGAPAPEAPGDLDRDDPTVIDAEEATESTESTESAPVETPHAVEPTHTEAEAPVADAAEDAPPAPPAPAVPRPPTMPAEAQSTGLAGGLPGIEDVTELVQATAVPAVGPTAEPAPSRVDAAGHALPRIMAVANQKGGVGKTTTAVNLGAALAEAGYRTLVVDLDPQGNASTGLGINIRDLQLSMYDVVIHEASIDDTIEATAMRNLFVAPASLDLAGAEIELVPAFSRELRLRHALAEVHDDYDYVLIDCPPSLGLLTVNGLAAAAEVLVPIQCEYYALEGLGQLLRNVALVQRNLNQKLQVSTFVCVMYDARTKLADQVVTEVRSHFGDKVCRIVVPRTVRLSEAPSYGQPILAFDPRSRGAIAYRELAREISGGARAESDD
ncbi:AAA family ATPase [Actinospongicola halichondriae]|uniref:ParA family protein n=1 Tax=Actinospongicola halichondriae TaxID=3236844 RepID=UPI003D55BE29